jgi:hypothetical protein
VIKPRRPDVGFISFSPFLDHQSIDLYKPGFLIYNYCITGILFCQ